MARPKHEIHNDQQKKGKELEDYEIDTDDSEVIAMFHEMMKGEHGDSVEVCGVTLNEPWKILKEYDEVAYNELMSNWIDSNEKAIRKQLSSYKDLAEEVDDLDREMDEAEEEESEDA